MTPEERRAAEKRTAWLYDQLGGLVNAEAEYVPAEPTVQLRLEEMAAREFLERLGAGHAAAPGPDEATVMLDVRRLDDREVQRFADAVLAILMPGSIGR